MSSSFVSEVSSLVWYWRCSVFVNLYLPFWFWMSFPITHTLPNTFQSDNKMNFSLFFCVILDRFTRGQQPSVNHINIILWSALVLYSLQFYCESVKGTALRTDGTTLALRDSSREEQNTGFWRNEIFWTAAEQQGGRLSRNSCHECWSLSNKNSIYSVCVCVSMFTRCRNSTEQKFTLITPLLVTWVNYWTQNIDFNVFISSFVTNTNLLHWKPLHIALLNSCWPYGSTSHN